MFEGNTLLSLIVRLKGEFFHRTERLTIGSWWASRTVSASTTATMADALFAVNTSAGAVAITLPAASASAGKLYALKKITSDANTASFIASGADTIDGATSVTATGYMQELGIVCDGATWYVTGVFNRYVTTNALAPSETVVVFGGRALYSPSYYDVPNGFAIDIRSGGILEVG